MYNIGKGPPFYTETCKSRSTPQNLLNSIINPSGDDGLGQEEGGSKRAALISCRAPRSFHEIVAEYVKQGPYLYESGFIGAAVREKIRRDTPELYKTVSQPRENPPQT